MNNMEKWNKEELNQKVKEINQTRKQRMKRPYKVKWTWYEEHCDNPWRSRTKSFGFRESAHEEFMFLYMEQMRFMADDPNWLGGWDGECILYHTINGKPVIIEKFNQFSIRKAVYGDAVYGLYNHPTGNE